MKRILPRVKIYKGGRLIMDSIGFSDYLLRLTSPPIITSKGVGLLSSQRNPSMPVQAHPIAFRAGSIGVDSKRRSFNIRPSYLYSRTAQLKR